MRSLMRGVIGRSSTGPLPRPTARSRASVEAPDLPFLFALRACHGPDFGVKHRNFRPSTPTNTRSSDRMPRLVYVNSGSAGSIVISGAREHNLRDIDVVLPRNSLVVITGLSGSGKSSLAFDTIYAEGQRRYVESLSAYARQFLGQMEKPDVDSIEGLSPAISIDQKTTSRNPRST